MSEGVRLIRKCQSSFEEMGTIHATHDVGYLPSLGDDLGIRLDKGVDTARAELMLEDQEARRLGTIYAVV